MFTQSVKLLQTALQLIQDPKGWEILGDLISNPDLIAQFINGKGNHGNTGNLLRSITRAGKSSKNSGKDVNYQFFHFIMRY